MTDKEFVEFMQGIVIGIKDLPTKKQWKKIMDKLSTVEGENFTINLNKEWSQRQKEWKEKKFPGSPPDIYC